MPIVIMQEIFVHRGQADKAFGRRRLGVLLVEVEVEVSCTSLIQSLKIF
jgi:hypothetical protein